MAYTPLSERVAKRLAEIQGLRPEQKPHSDFTPAQLSAMVSRAAIVNGTRQPFFRMTPYQIMKAVRDLQKKPGK